MQFAKKPSVPGFWQRIRFAFVSQGIQGGVSLIEKPQGRRIAVLAPHPDDDVIGCGGTLVKHHRSGDHVAVIYLTCGGRGQDAGGPRSTKLEATRRMEAEAAATLLGATSLTFLDFPDGEVTANPASCDKVKEALDEVSPDVIFLPSFLEEHPDHQATNRIFARLSTGFGETVSVLGYETWPPLTPNRLVDISSTIEIKEDALRKHASMMAVANYAETIRGLNRYRSLYMGAGKGHYEAFIEVKARTYGKLVKLTLGA